ncbi:hypothetical protein CYG49_01830 [Candidatus Saccharibacteria bacterium]|nr:MAG: hypothetical protein CYG49_01830 [Candidatus Saccharibacteria bacterium]
MKKLSQNLGRWTAAIAVVGVALAPIGASAATDTTSVEATVASVISVSSNPTVAISVTPTAAGTEATGTDTVTVDSNDADGYNLTLENDATLTMAGSQGGTLAKTAGTFATPAALGTNSWGYRLSGFAAGTFAGVEDLAQNIRSTTTTASAEATSVTYGVKVNTSVPAGVYTDTVTYTATVK